VPSDIELDVLLECDLDQPTEQVRAAPVRTGPNEPESLLLVHSGHPNIDPYANYLTFPEDTLKLTLASPEGEVQWTKDLGPGIVPGIWFCPVFPFDLDGDGTEEIWYVDTDDPEHPLTLEDHRLGRLDAETGETTGTWDWPDYPRETLSHTYRNFILGGHVDGDPVLVTAQGTYGEMKLQAWNPDMQKRWVHHVPADAPGARGSHMCPVIDLDGDGDDEILWGERCIGLDAGTQLFCADRDTWDDHSDIVLPTLDPGSGEWYIYTCREGTTQLPPRVVMFDSEGSRVWSAVDEGHMHRGWTARIGDGGERVAMAGRSKNAPHDELDEFLWGAFSGEPREVEFPVYSTRPVDLDGDGVHELLYGGFDRTGRLIDNRGTEIGNVDPNIARVQPSKLVDHPGEQVVSYTDDGTVRVWGDRNAEDTPEATARYEHPYYRKAQRLSAVGYNWRNVAGL